MGRKLYRQKLKVEAAKRNKKLKEDRQTKSHWSQIEWKPHPSEFEIQSFIYTSLMNKGFLVRGEVTALSRSKFDLVVFSEDKVPLRIIEVKRLTSAAMVKSANNTAIGAKSLSELQKQVRRYLTYEIPVDLVCGMDAAKQYVDSFSVTGPSQLPEDVVWTDGWNGIVSDGEFLNSKLKVEETCRGFLKAMNSNCHPKSRPLIDVVRFDKEVGTLFCRVYDKDGTSVKCIFEVGHGDSLEPESLVSKRIEAGREIARQYETYLIRVCGKMDVWKFIKEMKAHGKNAFTMGCKYTDRETKKIVDQRNAVRKREAEERRKREAEEASAVTLTHELEASLC